MYALDATEIGWMPSRGTASLWPSHLTDFGKSAYVWLLFAMLVVVALVASRLQGVASLLLGLGTRRFVFFAVLVPVLTGELIKWMVGRGRPFVGGEANVFNFAHFAGTEAYASFPSGHTTTAAALAFAVAACCGLQARTAMIVYVVVIALSRLVLLAHHRATWSRARCLAWSARWRCDTGSPRAAWGLPSVATAPLCRCRAPLWGTSKGLPARPQPHKKRTPHTPPAAVPAAGQLKRRVLICLLLTKPRWPFRSLFPCATKPTTSAR
jgi:hypothetical protein